ncbi:hypothetical protein HYPSUDRAFT_48117 [Hypholoma sublateritium FD-334 SS-4]|uniref:Uncharacterized protein n=1 Tax=Hypholoma sublateritium (strain FD-334 SS-4) TaxID=945553 RepID=A0A0D2KM41_HYPSF|nr:hypothetical protein HYPSUDRAFT_48117 [Hypholoma sublateritium FD-334 SS-4]
MHTKIIFSFVLAACAVGLGHARECIDKHVLESKPLTLASGHVVTMETFNCSNVDTTPVRREPPQARHTYMNLERAASQCTQANCICGIPCFFNGCSAVTQTIRASDCTSLANSLMNNPGTFTIPPNQGVAFILQSCEYGAFSPSVTDTIQYCFSDMGAAALQTFDTCGTQQGSCKGTFQGANFFVDQLSL